MKNQSGTATPAPGTCGGRVGTGACDRVAAGRVEGGPDALTVLFLFAILPACATPTVPAPVSTTSIATPAVTPVSAATPTPTGEAFLPAVQKPDCRRFLYLSHQASPREDAASGIEGQQHQPDLLHRSWRAFRCWLRQL